MARSMNVPYIFIFVFFTLFVKIFRSNCLTSQNKLNKN